MKRYRQSLDELLSALTTIGTSWKDKHSEAVIGMLKRIPAKSCYGPAVIGALLAEDFDAALTVIRLILELSKDEFWFEFKQQFSGRSPGVMAYKADPAAFLNALDKLQLFQLMQQVITQPVTWQDIIVERLKAGRGSAIKGQARGRKVENIVEETVKCIFSQYDTRQRFTGATGLSTEKADFAIPSKGDPRILIEVKAYGATGSKQTDILGDIGRIVDQKRNDTDLLLVTDGITWNARVNDLRKLVALQNVGKIGRIYTLSMIPELREDLLQLKGDHAL